MASGSADEQTFWVEAHLLSASSRRGRVGCCHNGARHGAVQPRRWPATETLVFQKLLRRFALFAAVRQELVNMACKTMVGTFCLGCWSAGLPHGQRRNY